ncbi:MAG: DUF3006 domain-containing protein [Syntrophomonadaceae bacterium]|nr:DUF3006 domain-containing protein [Syntrophomonadaceae bacterium]
MIIIDRFESYLAIVEYEGKTWNIPREWLPASAGEGDVIIINAAVDEQATVRRRKEMQEKLHDLFE